MGFGSFVLRELGFREISGGKHWFSLGVWWGQMVFARFLVGKIGFR